jgi:hypothetical protein
MVHALMIVTTERAMLCPMSDPLAVRWLNLTELQ